MTADTAADLAASVYLRYPAEMTLAQASAAVSEIDYLLKAHPTYHEDDDHIYLGLRLDGSLEVVLFASRAELFAYGEEAVARLMAEKATAR
jgi:hypothetical protein